MDPTFKFKGAAYSSNVALYFHKYSGGLVKDKLKNMYFIKDI